MVYHFTSETTIRINLCIYHYIDNNLKESLPEYF